MMNRRLCTVVLLGTLVSVAALFAGRRSVALAREEAGGGGESILDQLVDEDNVNVKHTDEGLVITAKKHARQARLWTKASFDLPVDITMVAKTDSKNLRLYFAKGCVLLNWEVWEDDLRFLGPKNGYGWTAKGKGRIPANKFVTVRWTVANDGTHVYVDGVERFSMKGEYGGSSGRIGVGTLDDAVVTVKSLTLSRGGASKDQPTKEPVATGGGKPSADGFIDVPCAKPDPAAHVTATSRPADDATIERPEFRDRPKAIVKSISSVTSMMVIHGDDGQATGLTSDIIATVPPESRRGSKASVGFYRKDGDEQMHTAFDEALRAVELRYPLWEPGRIEFSFGEKFTSHGGPSAGTAFGILMLSCLEGFDVDPRCAITGDVSVDWRVRKVGGVTAKLRGAALDKCLYAGIPVDNATAFADMPLLYGNDSLWAIQVFTIADLHEAVALARTDRPDRLARAMKLFGDLQDQLNKNPRVALHAPGTKSTLLEILSLAPNHLSAKCVLALCDGTAPKTLSMGATSYQLSIIYAPYLELIHKGQRIDRTTLPKAVTVMARKRLATLRAIAHKDYQPLMADVGTFIETMDELADHSISAATAAQRVEESRARFSAVEGDPKFMENFIRDGY